MRTGAQIDLGGENGFVAASCDGAKSPGVGAALGEREAQRRTGARLLGLDLAGARGGAVVTSASIRWHAACATSATARLKAYSLALDGRLKPESLRTELQ